MAINWRPLNAMRPSGLLGVSRTSRPPSGTGQAGGTAVVGIIQGLNDMIVGRQVSASLERLSLAAEHMLPRGAPLGVLAVVKVDVIRPTVGPEQEFFSNAFIFGGAFSDPGSAIQSYRDTPSIESSPPPRARRETLFFWGTRT